jgi:hypothetical protein
MVREVAAMGLNESCQDRKCGQSPPHVESRRGSVTSHRNRKQARCNLSICTQQLVQKYNHQIRKRYCRSKSMVVRLCDKAVKASCLVRAEV